MHHSLSFPSHFAVSEWNMTTLWVSWTQRDLQEVFKGSAMITENKGDGLEKAHVGASKWSMDASLSPPTIFFASLGERRPVSTCPKCRRFCAPSARLTFQTASKSKRPRRGAPPLSTFPVPGVQYATNKKLFPIRGGPLVGMVAVTWPTVLDLYQVSSNRWVLAKTNWIFPVLLWSIDWNLFRRSLVLISFISTIDFYSVGTIFG